MDRRSFLALAPVAAALPTMLAPPPASAAAPRIGTQAPGFHRLILGDVEVTALLDGTIAMPFPALYTNTTPARVDGALAAAFLKSPVQTSVNAFLINTGDRLVMIDAGTGVFLGPSLGHLPAALHAAGYAPEQIDAILLTHIHTDHSGGLVHDGGRVFPNAVVHANRREAEYWLSAAHRDAAPADKRRYYQEAQAAIRPYLDAGRFQVFGDDADPIPGFGSILRPGHTPGHSSFVIGRGDARLVLWGDITHGDIVQFDEPGVGISFDENTAEAAATRSKAFQEATRERYWVAGAHIAFPGIGHVREDATGYDWLPGNYEIPG